MFVLLLLRHCPSSSTWPLSHEQNAVTVTTPSGNYRWDFSQGVPPDIVYAHFIPALNFTIYARPFKPLSATDVPFWIDISTYGMNVARCGQISGRQQCLGIATIYGFEWTPKNDNDLNEGILWASNGEPNDMGDDVFESWEFEF
jgi:hypothetical protein